MDLAKARDKWRYRGTRRPKFAIEPAGHQESVWDYPRPPALTADTRHITVHDAQVLIADTSRAQRVLETAGAPCFYIHQDDVEMRLLVRNRTRTFCEWKGHAHGYDTVSGVEDVAWSYAEPFVEFTPISGWIAFYPRKVICRVDGERVLPQPGEYYGGWITSEVVGPFKGEPSVDDAIKLGDPNARI